MKSFTIMKEVAVNGQLRSELGKKATKAVRKAGMIPCVLYGGDDVLHFTTSLADVRGLIYSPDFQIAEIRVDGKTYRSLLKDVQFHPVSDEVVHIDFLRLIEGTPVKVELPLRFHGISPGVKSGGKLIQKVRRIKVKALPEALTDELRLDISSIKMNQSIRVRDIRIAEGMEILNSPGIPVVSVEMPRALRGAAAVAEEEEAEGEEQGAESQTEGTEE